MFRGTILGVVFVSAFVFAPGAYAGKMELTTYYPAPYGEYSELQTDSLKFANTATPPAEGTACVGEEGKTAYNSADKALYLCNGTIYTRATVGGSSDVAWIRINSNGGQAYSEYRTYGGVANRIFKRWRISDVNELTHTPFNICKDAGYAFATGTCRTVYSGWTMVGHTVHGVESVAYYILSCNNWQFPLDAALSSAWFANDTTEIQCVK